jgi:hypothetical protein
MLERSVPILKLACLSLTLLLAYQLVRLVVQPNPLKHLSIPPTLTSHPFTLPLDTAEATNTAPKTRAAKKESPIAPAVEARIQAIARSEIFGALPTRHAMPMTLLGIAGNDVLLRLPTGQTKLLRRGEQVGGVKLLRIGTNRVLVESEGKQQELTIFAGLGGLPLLPQPKENRQ